MPAENESPCYTETWIDPEKVLTECGSLCPEVLEHDLQDEFDDAASFFHWVTGGIYSCCDRTAKPCWNECDGCAGHWDGQMRPIRVGGEWMNTRCGCPCGRGNCCETIGLPLSPGPVHEVFSVVIDGQVLDPGSWELEEESNKVILLDGREWPDCGGIEVSYRSGKVPPAFMRRAAREYARELACLCYCPTKCKLPTNWSEVRYAHLNVKKNAPKSSVLSPLIGLSPNMTRALSPFIDQETGRPRRPARVATPDLVL